MFRSLLFLLIVAALALMFSWVADRPGIVTLVWQGTNYEVSLMVALSALVALIAVILFIWGMVRGLIRTPSLISQFFQTRRRDRGYQALSRGLIAASSGDVDTARSLARESGKLLKNEPLVSLLSAQTALLEGKRDEARVNFQAMLGQDNTKLVALRGLFLEAERQGESEAARHYAIEAAAEAPSLPWAGIAKLRYQAVDGDWDEALKTLEANRAAGLIDREKAKRQRAVLLTAKAYVEEPADPDTAVRLSRDAHKLAKDLVPAAVIHARAAGRQGDIRSASKILEAAWKIEPHPELADAYVNVRSGDAAQDKLKRATRLAKLRTNHPEGNLAVCQAAIDALDWDTAREAIEPVLTNHISERACLLMAEIEEGEHGDKGRMRDWLSRAVRAPADPAWTADGQVSETWLPVSLVTGEIDAFEWKVPVEQLDAEETVITLEDIARMNEAPAGDEEKAIEVEIDADSPAESAVDIIDAEEIVEEAETVEVDPVEPEGENASAPDEKPDVAEENVETKPNGKPEPEPENASGTKSGTVEFALDRRPDDPGVDPEKVPDKKGFKLF